MRSRRGKARSPRGFTLLELVAVMALMALLFGVATVSFKDACRTARAQAAIEGVLQLDRRIRDHARRFGKPAELMIDLDRGVFFETQELEGKSRTNRVPLGGGIRIDRVFVGPEIIRSGRATVEFARDGRSPTYALKLTQKVEDARWLVFAGATGQVVEEQDDKEIEDMFRQLFAQRSNLD